MQKNRKVLFAAIAAAFGLGTAVNAQAGAYAYSYLNVTDFVITGTNTVFVLPSTVTSEASASLTGFATVNNGGVGFTNTLPAQINVAKANDDFTPVGPVGFNFARGDAAILKEQSKGDPFTQAVNVAEANLVANGTGTGRSRNASDTSFNISVAAGGGSLDFVFKADPYLKIILLPAGLLSPSLARAGVSMNIQIVDNTGNTVFSYAPTGLTGVGPITGGNDLSDPYSLNRTIARNFGNTGTTTYDPTGCPVGDPVAQESCATLGTFHATTSTLAPGTYTLTLQDQKTADVALAIPEPDSLLLVGIAFSALGFISRRKKAA